MKTLFLTSILLFTCVSVSASDIISERTAEIDCDELADNVVHDLEQEGGYSSAELVIIHDSVKKNCEKGKGEERPKLSIM